MTAQAWSGRAGLAGAAGIARIRIAIKTGPTSRGRDLRALQPDWTRLPRETSSWRVIFQTPPMRRMSVS